MERGEGHQKIEERDIQKLCDECNNKEHSHKMSDMGDKQE